MSEQNRMWWSDNYRFHLEEPLLPYSELVVVVTWVPRQAGTRSCTFSVDVWGVITALSAHQQKVHAQGFILAKQLLRDLKPLYTHTLVHFEPGKDEP